MGIARSEPALACHGWSQSFLQRNVVDPGRGLSIHAVEERLLVVLPDPARLFDRGMARWRAALFDGSAARHVLRWLLLAVDGAALCGGRDEPTLGRDHRRSGSLRESRPWRAIDDPRQIGLLAMTWGAGLLVKIIGM